MALGHGWWDGRFDVAGRRFSGGDMDVGCIDLMDVFFVWEGALRWLGWGVFWGWTWMLATWIA
eukprot:4607779-Amphidinium_carterae.1